MKPEIKALDGRTVQMILSHLTLELRQEIPAEETHTIQSAEEARTAIAALLSQVEPSAPDPGKIVPEESDADLAAREMLDLLLDDPATAPKVRELLAHPPRDSQMSVELAISSAIVLGAVITWLQTKVELKVNRKDGKTDFSFAMKKAGTSNSLLKTVAETVKKALFLP